MGLRGSGLGVRPWGFEALGIQEFRDLGFRFRLWVVEGLKVLSVGG